MQPSIGLPGLLAALVIGGLCVSSLQRWDSGRAGGKLSAGGAGAADGRLRFRLDGTFKILQITDIHYGEMNATLDEMSNEVQRTLLAAEKPDLVIFSGDLVSGWVCPPFSAAPPGGTACGRPRWWEERWEQLTAPVRAAGHPWAIILGNHDAEGPLNRREVIDLAVRTARPWGLTRQGPAAATGASNYWLDVHPPLMPAGSGVADGSGGGTDSSSVPAAHSGIGSGVAAGRSVGASSGSSGSGNGGGSGVAGGDAPAARVWLLDSMDRTCPPLIFGWGCVADDTLAWLNSTAHSLPRVPSLAFVHIPIPQFMEVWAGEPTVGSKQEDVACSARDTGLFSLAREIGMNAIYSGHDHNNDYVGVLEGVRLAYGRKSGHGGYGPPQGWLRGARVIELRMEQDTSKSKTWISQEDGTSVSQQPSQQAKEMQQLFCHCDELGAQPDLKAKLMGALGKEAGRSPSEVLAELLQA